jgi:uncharacterized delta-60 repeat protein
VVKTDFGGVDEPRALTLQANGKVIVAGRAEAAEDRFGLARYNADGRPDDTYGSGGSLTTAIGSGSQANAVAVQPWDGKIVAAGWAYPGSNSDFAIARYLPSAPQVGSFAASPSPAAAGDAVTLTAGNITDGNAGASITRIAFYVDSNGDGKLDVSDALLGYGTPAGGGTWTLTFATTVWVAGTYTLFAQAADSYGALGDAVTLTLQVN